MNRRPTPFSLSRHLTHLLVCIYIFSPLAIPIVSLQAGDEIIDFDNRPFNEVTPYSPSNMRFDQKNRYLFHRDFGSYRFLQKDYRLFIDEVGSASSASLPDNGTDYARDLPASTPITIVRVDGHPFELRSFDIAEYSSVRPQPVIVFITGVKSDHSEVTASFVSDGRFDGSGPLEDFETLMLPDGFVDLVRVDIETSGCHLDNFRLSGPDFLPRNTDYPARPIIFDLTWESDRFPENLPPETGGFDAPTLVFSLPLVQQSSSAFAGKSLFLQRGQHPAGWIAAENDDAEGFQIAHNANASSYHVSTRLLIPHLSTSGEGEKLSISLTASPYAINLIFNSNGTISFSVNHHSDEETIANFTFGKPLGIGIRVDRRSGMILIDKDGQTVHTESLGAPILDITETKMLLHSASGSSSSAEVADFRVTGNEIPLFYEARGPIPEVPVLQPSATPFLFADVGVTVSRPIVIKNIGDEELRIDAIEFTSSSLQVKAELPLFISPGETGSITVSYTGEDPSLGRQYGDMYVYSNSDISPIRRSFEFLTRGHGKIAVLPQSVNRVMRANSQSVFNLALAYYGINPSYSFNIQFPAEGQDLPVPTVPITPNDPLFSSQWHHRTPASGSAGIDTTRAWSVTRGSPLVVVAVVDTGVNFDHPDLQDARNHGNQGYDFLDDDNDPSDPSIDPFGTFVAGVIGATGNNGQGGAGVASNVKIMALRYSDADRGIGFASDAADCITYAANNGANVINNSWGSNNFSGAILLAIETALRKGITVVNSAGNRGLSNDLTPYYPASYVARSLAGTDDAIAVAASTENDNLMSNSSFGAVSVDVAAPGRNILGTWRNDTYDTDSGAGQSTAIVSGVAALLYSQDPLITPHDVKTAILSSVDKLASLEGKVASGGRVNAARALEQRAQQWLSTPDGGASTLARGETAQAEFTIDTTGLAPGRYSKNIFFYETNTYGLSGEIPLTIDVIGDITDPPTILQQQSVAAGAEVGKTTSLRIETLGEPIAYQWYRGSPGDTSDPVGEDSGTFVTEEHVFPGTETYWVRLTNANGYTDSSEYRINVVIAPPHAPRDLTATSGSFPDRVRISWSPVSGADSYDVYRSVDWTFAAASRIALDLSSTTFDDLDVNEGELFYYWVISKGAGGSSLPGGPNSGRISLETPASLSQLDASNGTERNSIRLNWDRASNAISYDVFRSASERFEEAVLLGSTHTTEWLDMEHAAPGSYFYWVRARNPDREGAPTVSALSETGHSTPDVWVISREGNLTGNGSHSAKDGISTAGIHSKSFSGVSYTTYIKNEGSMTDSYLISIRTSKTDLVTTHIDRATGFNISAALIAGTWKSDSVSPGEMRAILSTTKPSGRLARSKRRSFNSLGMVTGQAELSFPTPDSVGLRFSFVRKIRKGSNRK